jgi:leader peptidase (prepilin peptidase)/N-methyltransferase
MRQVVILAVLLAAAMHDARTMRVPNAFPVMIALCGLLPPGAAHPAGILAALPLLVAALWQGGIGGGDVKVVAALGFALGLNRGLLILALGLFYMIAWDRFRRQFGAGRRSYPFVPFLFAATLITGMF